MYDFLYYPIASFLICLAVTPLVRAVARARGWIAVPTADRWHKKTTALCGGIAIWAGACLPLLFISQFSPQILMQATRTRILLDATSGAVLFTGATFMFVLGLVDDFARIKPQTKLLGQILAASLVTVCGYRLQWSPSLTADTLLTILWIVGITNAMNLMDNMDGLCAGIGCIAAFFLSILLFPVSPKAAMAALLLCGALAAFLVFNFNPASIFMGDCGSLVIGFTLAFLSVRYTEYAVFKPVLSRYAVPLLALLVPVFDTTLVTLIRLLSGRRASMGGKDHTSHRLVLIGFSEKRAVVFLYGTAALAGLSALFVNVSDSFTSPVVIVPMLLSFLLLGIYLAQIRVYPEKEFSVLRHSTFTPIWLELTSRRQLALVLLDFGLISFAYYLSYRVRFSGPQFGQFFEVFFRSLPLVIACKFVAFSVMGVYRGIWGFFSANDVYTHIKATVLGSLLSVALVTFLYRFQDFSKGIFIIDWFLVTGLVLGTRGSFWLFRDYMRRSTLQGDRVLLYGAGAGGEILLKELVSNKSLRLVPVGFLDDDPLKAGKRHLGLSILGGMDDIGRIASEKNIAGLVISFTGGNGRLAEIKKICAQNSLFLKRMHLRLEDVDPEE